MSSSNRTTTLLALIVGTFLFVGCLSCAGLVWFLDWGNDLVASGDQQANEGATFGPTASEALCIDEALRRTDRDCGMVDVSCYAGGEEFLTACLRAAPALDATFCDGVPPDTFMETMTWTGDVCIARGYAEGSGCEQVMHGVVRHCAAGLPPRAATPTIPDPAIPNVGSGTGPGSSAPPPTP